VALFLYSAKLDDFNKTVQVVEKGEKVLPPPLAASLFCQIAKNGLESVRPLSFNKTARKTKREQEIITLLGEGLRNKEIAQEFNLNRSSIER